MTALRDASEPTLGIIGGAGVGAAAQLYVDVSARVHAATDALPRIALWNIPATDAVLRAAVAADGDPKLRATAEQLVAEAIDRLLDAGATVIAMPCNSLQRVAIREAARAGVPFIDMIAATIEAALKTGARRGVLISTASTQANGEYEGLGLEIVPLQRELRGEADELIHGAVARMPIGDRLQRLIDAARRPDACVLLGCTDICGLVNADEDVVESLACLTDRCAQAICAVAAAA
jgi:aspartate racemase